MKINFDKVLKERKPLCGKCCESCAFRGLIGCIRNNSEEDNQ